MRFTGFFITLASVAFWIAVPEYWEEFKKLLNEIHPSIIPAGLVVLMCIGGIVFIYDYKKCQPKSNISKETYQKIYTELKDGIDSLDGTLDRTTMQYEIDGKEINYKHIRMNHKVFDGLVNSGDFSHIDHELQQPLQDIYGKISIHNEYVNKIIELDNNPQTENEYVLILNRYEKELLREIPPMMEKLKIFFS